MRHAIRSVLLLSLLGSGPPLAAQAGPPRAAEPAVPTLRAPADRLGAAATPLAELVAEAERQNPEIQAAAHAWQAATEVPRQAAALPDPQLSVQQVSVGSPRPLAGFNDSSFAYVGVGGSQELPYPGKRALRRAVAVHEAESAHEAAGAVRRRVVEALKLAYYRLAYVQQALGILARNDQLLEQVEQVIEARYRVGQGNQQDVLRAQLQHSKILQDIAIHHQDEGQAEAQLKQILNRQQSSPDIVAATLSASAFRRGDAELLRRAQEQNPDLRSRSYLVSRQEAQVSLAKKELRPDFNLQYMYQHTGSRFADYYMATFGIRLPNRRRQAAALAEAEENRARAEQERQAEVQRVLAEVAQQSVLVRTSEERLEIYNEGLIPQSEATFQAGLAAYESNRQDLETLLANFLDVLHQQLEYRRELVEHESALARLERLTGVTLP
jgi:cobalt-zinc-cadmium efflux system outer membrane protein